MTATSLGTSFDGWFRDALRRTFGRGTAKKAAPWAGASDHAVEQWVQCRREPGLWTLFRLVRHPAFRAELRAYLDHIEMEEAKTALPNDDITAQRLRHPAGDAGVPGTPKPAVALCATTQAAGIRRGGVKR